MKLFYSTISPFARKVRVALQLLGLEQDCKLAAVIPAESPSALLQANPLSKIPTLILDDGTALCDSSLILQYLHSLQPNYPLYPQGKDQWQRLHLAQLMHGVMDAAVLIVMERRRPAGFAYPPAIERQQQVIQRVLQTLETASGLLSTTQASVLEINTAVALDYVDFRLPETEWRATCPRLHAWHVIYCQRPEIQATVPS